MTKKDTKGRDYTKRLVRPKTHWKEVIDVQRPYRWNINRLEPGITLDVGTGTGRILKHLPAGSVGVDHNPHSIEESKKLGLIAFQTKDFFKSKYAKKNTFDSILLTHVIEHMDEKDNLRLLKDYTPFLKKGGKVIIACPQEKGFSTDDTHVRLYDFVSLGNLLGKAGFTVSKHYSFPFPRSFGKIFTYNEFIVVATLD